MSAKGMGVNPLYANVSRKVGFLERENRRTSDKTYFNKTSLNSEVGDEGSESFCKCLKKKKVLFMTPSLNCICLATRFIALLLEDMFDEWGTKVMFGMRWMDKVDQVD